MFRYEEDFFRLKMYQGKCEFLLHMWGGILTQNAAADIRSVKFKKEAYTQKQEHMFRMRKKERS